MISGFGIVLVPLCYSVLYSVVPGVSAGTHILEHSGSLNEKAASAAAHDFDEPVETPKR
jgi:hypothetical protein